MRTILLSLELWGYLESFLRVLPLESDQLLLVAVQAETWHRYPCLGHVEQVQSVPLIKLGWLTSFCGHLLEKDQEELPKPARKSPLLDSLPGALVSGPPRVWPRCNSEWGNHDPMLSGKPGTFYLGPVGCPRPGLKILGRGRGESRQ